MWFLIVSSLVAVATPSRKFKEVTGGERALEASLAAHRDRLPDHRAGLLADRREQVRLALEHADCAVHLAPPPADLFSAAQRGQVTDTPEAEFLAKLLSAKWYDRREAYRTLVVAPPRTGEPLRQTFAAVLALIEADLRSEYVRMFLTLQPRWPAAFVNRLRDFAAKGTQGDRIYVVNLIRRTGRVNDAQVRRSFNLDPDPEWTLDEIIRSNGRWLWGEGHPGAAPDAPSR